MKNVNSFSFKKANTTSRVLMCVYVCNFVQMWEKMPKGAQQKSATLMSLLGGDLKTKRKSRILCGQKTEISQDDKACQTL